MVAAEPPDGKIRLSFTCTCPAQFGLTVDLSIAGLSLLQVRGGGDSTNGVRLEVMETKNSADNWACYP
jgi:hypothetical protein